MVTGEQRSCLTCFLPTLLLLMQWYRFESEFKKWEGRCYLLQLEDFHRHWWQDYYALVRKTTVSKKNIWLPFIPSNEHEKEYCQGKNSNYQTKCIMGRIKEFQNDFGSITVTSQLGNTELDILQELNRGGNHSQ